MLSWLLAPWRLKRLGVLGMNARNAACILDHNPRSLYPLVDDKLRMSELCGRIGVPTPAVYGIVESYSQLRRLPELLGEWCAAGDFVVKPNRGSGGRGVAVFVGREGEQLRKHDGSLVPLDALRRHLSDVLSGLYSLGGRPDRAILQQRVTLHPDFTPIAHKGIPDVRVVVYRGEPAMAMLRLPTRQSGGRANLHQGGIGAGVDLTTGRTHHAVQRNHQIDRHPDTGERLVGHAVPHWDAVLDLSRKVARAVGLGYVGVDVVVDAESGPLLLEANARPGLAIQIANGEGLRPRLAAIDVLIANRDKSLCQVPTPFRPATRAA